MDNVQNCDSCVNIPSFQTCGKLFMLMRRLVFASGLHVFLSVFLCMRETVRGTPETANKLHITLNLKLGLEDKLCQH
jgi:hypothetical protein